MLELAAEKIAYIGGIPITNSIFASLLVSLFLVIIAIIFSRKVNLYPSKFQNFIEFIVEFLYNTAYESVGDKKRTNAFFPIVATFFIFILACNWVGLLPIFNTIGFYQDFAGHATKLVPLFRPINSDLNITGSLALISAIATQYFAIKFVGIKHHLAHYFSINPINLFVGLLELVSEFTKIISLSFRLYGNIIAGDVVIGTFTTMTGFLVPLPFMGLEIVVGFVQAAVFAMLTLAFTNVLSQKLH
jgi:F-type H+-transporting ATPase subunit a